MRNKITSLEFLKKQIVWDYNSIRAFGRAMKIEQSNISRLLKGPKGGVRNKNIEAVLRERYNLPQDFFDKHYK